MFGTLSGATPLDLVAHIIQIALTPVFLLTGIATLLNVFSTRLARVADRVDQLSQAMDGAEPDQTRRLAAQLTYLKRRSVALDIAVILAALGGAATCAAVLTLFVGALRNATGASILFLLFGGAVVSALGAIAAFTVEMLMAGVGVRTQLAQSRELTEDAPEIEPQNHGSSDDVASSPPSA